MESLNSLANSLEPKEGHSLEHNEQVLTKDFRDAALSITTLYRSSLQASKQAYDSGYSACLADVLNFIQKGVSSSTGDLAVSGEEWQRDASTSMTVGRVMDWIEARLDAVGGKDEDEQEEEQPPRPSKLPTSTTHGARNRQLQKDISPVERTPPREPSPSSPHERSITPPVIAPSHSPLSSPQARAYPLPLPKRKTRGRSKDIPGLGVQPLGFSSINNTATTPFTFSLPMSDVSLVNSALSGFVLPDVSHSPTTPYPGVGSKRRHSEVSHPPAHSAPAGAAPACNPRSQKRRTRNALQQQQQMEGMEMEDDSSGRERDRRKQTRR